MKSTFHPAAQRARWHLLAISLMYAALMPDIASACSMPLTNSEAKIKQIAQAMFEQASLVIDAEVVSPMNSDFEWQEGLVPIAYLKVLHVWKGEAPVFLIPVVYIDSCSIDLTTKGQKIRILLEGKGVFSADMGMNGASVVDLSKFNSEIDRLIGQRRSDDIAPFPGALETPPEDGSHSH